MRLFTALSAAMEGGEHQDRVVSRTDMGTYTCTATNALGVSAPEAVDVVTYCKYS